MSELKPNYNHDLRPSSANPGPLTTERVWTICELIIYRFRDKMAAKDSLAYKDCCTIADEVREIRMAWERYDRFGSQG
jgi:hypothetical protein